MIDLEKAIRDAADRAYQNRAGVSEGMSDLDEKAEDFKHIVNSFIQTEEGMWFNHILKKACYVDVFPKAPNVSDLYEANSRRRLYQEIIGRFLTPETKKEIAEYERAKQSKQ